MRSACMRSLSDGRRALYKCSSTNPTKETSTLGLAECRPPNRPRLGLHPITVWQTISIWSSWGTYPWPLRTQYTPLRLRSRSCGDIWMRALAQYTKEGDSTIRVLVFIRVNTAVNKFKSVIIRRVAYRRKTWRKKKKKPRPSIGMPSECRSCMSNSRTEIIAIHLITPCKNSSGPLWLPLLMLWRYIDLVNAECRP